MRFVIHHIPRVISLRFVFEKVDVLRFWLWFFFPPLPPFHTMFITLSNRSEWMRRINQTAWQVYVFHGRQGLATWLKAVLTAFLDRLWFNTGLSEISVLAGNCVGLGRWSVQSPSSVLGVYPSFPALRFISFCSIQTLLHRFKSKNDSLKMPFKLYKRCKMKWFKWLVWSLMKSYNRFVLIIFPSSGLWNILTE